MGQHTERPSAGGFCSENGQEPSVLGTCVASAEDSCGGRLQGLGLCGPGWVLRVKFLRW